MNIDDKKIKDYRRNIARINKRYESLDDQIGWDCIERTLSHINKTMEICQIRLKGYGIQAGNNILSPSLDSIEGWRITYFDNEMKPIFHCEYSNHAKALEDFTHYIQGNKDTEIEIMKYRLCNVA